MGKISKYMYANRRREHIHIIRQFNNLTSEYTGTRIIIFKKISDRKYDKDIIDIDNFKIHHYKNPKEKKPSKSNWNIVDINIENILKKEMYNYSIDMKYKMKHILYESSTVKLSDYLKDVLEKEKLYEEYNKFYLNLSTKLI